MAPDPHAPVMDDEIAEIENRRGRRTLFLTLGGLALVLLLAIVVFGARERMRLREEAARPRFEDVTLGRYLGTVSNQAVFSEGDRLHYVEGVGDATIDGTTAFARAIEYDPTGVADTLPAAVTHWTLVQSDSLPYTIEPVLNPLTGVSPSDFRELDIGTIDRDMYGGGGPSDWRPLEMERTNVRVTGQIERSGATLYIVDEPSRVRLQGIEGLSALDSLEIAWAAGGRAPLTAFGTIGSTPGVSDPALFVLTVDAVHPPSPGERETPPGGGAAPADTAAAAPAAPAAGDTVPGAGT